MSTVHTLPSFDDCTLELLAADDWFAAHEAERAELEAEADYLDWHDSHNPELTDEDFDRLHEIRLEGLIAGMRASTTPVLEAVADLSDDSLVSVLGVPPTDVDTYRRAVNDELASRLTVAA